jgi:hypothetical protein
MILIAATAVACLVVQTTVGPVNPTELWTTIRSASASSWTALDVVDMLGELGVMILAPVLVVGSATVVLTAIGVPRSGRFGLCLEPGILACLQVLVVVILIACVGLVRYLAASTAVDVRNLLNTGFAYVAGLAGPVVVASWITIALAGVWRPAPWWADRLGRLLGIAWIALVPMVVSYAFLLML